MIEKNETCRNYGIDLLRIVSMFFVLILHSLGRGGILENASLNSSSYKVAWLLEIIAYSAVDIFALISGYVSVMNKDKKNSINRYLELWLEVVFYSLLINLFFYIINPSVVDLTDCFKSFLPVTNSFPSTITLYWYFTAYTGLFIVKPFLDKGIDNCDKTDLKKIFILIIIFFSIYNYFNNKFILNEGYSFIWITLLYILGAAINKANIGEKVKSCYAIIGIIILVAMTYITKIYYPEFVKGAFVSYISPTILLTAILYVIVFSKINIKKMDIRKIIKFFSTSVFSIYLLNTHYLVWDNLMNELFINISNSGALVIFSNIIVFSITFLICSVLIDKIRILIFKVFRINRIINHISELLNKIIEKISIII